MSDNLFFRFVQFLVPSIMFDAFITQKNIYKLLYLAQSLLAVSHVTIFKYILVVTIFSNNLSLPTHDFQNLLNSFYPSNRILPSALRLIPNISIKLLDLPRWATDIQSCPWDPEFNIHLMKTVSLSIVAIFQRGVTRM